MDEFSFDIFRGATDMNAVWIASLAGLPEARQRMERIARIRPGRYFVFSQSSNSIVARIDTTKYLVLPLNPQEKIA